MSTISEVFSNGSNHQGLTNKKVLITYITAGDPNLTITEKLIYDLEASGADIIELGIPFSDPLADGPVIQASHQRALKNNTKLADVFKLVGKVRKKTQIPICFMLSYNLILQYGESDYYADCQKFGVNGSIVPDLPPEELQTQNLKTQSKSQSQTSNILLVAPTSSEERIKMIAERSSGFIYLISVAGITGKRKVFSPDLFNLIGQIRKYTTLPIAIGFGISGPAQAKLAAQMADGVIVGSAIVDLITKKKIKQVSKFVSSLKKAISN
ncbi:MAG: tryptophan synthase subunit alpha [bacterium]